MSQENKTHGVPWQIRHAAERTRADLKAGGKNYPDLRALLEYVESLIAAPQSPVAPADERALQAAAKAVENSAAVWEGFAIQDAKTCVQAYFAALSASKEEK